MTPDTTYPEQTDDPETTVAAPKTKSKKQQAEDADGMKVRKGPGQRKNWRRIIDPPDGIDNQPVQTIRWVDRNELHANDYNPNHVAPPELRLLKISILADGWTQPIVARSSGEIVDGFHRWTVAEDTEVAKMTGGKVPVVFLSDNVSDDHQQMSTIRHNRARGTHHVVKMADIVCDLHARGNDPERIAELMQMEHEEVQRFLDHGNMLQSMEKKTGGQFGTGWTVEPGSNGKR